jgi:NAD+ synthetase
MLVKRQAVEQMHQENCDLLAALRQVRNFNVIDCLTYKTNTINNYFREHGLSAAVVGVSGGIDSAVAVGLLSLAARMEHSPIKRIVAISLPCRSDQGASNQETATERGRAVAQAFGVEYICAELAGAFGEMRNTVARPAKIIGNAWADGQLIAYLRTPALYYLSALLTADGTPAIVCGTTNRDEGSYLGFFGKASDGMTDLQLISDLHKSEIYALGEALRVPRTTLSAEPTGDVFDGKTHLEMIGTPYDFVEIYTQLLCLSQNDRSARLSALSASALSQFTEWSERIESMHRYNAHKYMGGNPSVHISLYPRAVPGGWKDEAEFCSSTPPRKLVGEFPFNPVVALEMRRTRPATTCVTPVRGLSGEAQIIDRLLSTEESQLLIEQVKQRDRLPVGNNGIRRDYTAGVTAVGSFRATGYSPELAATLWHRIKKLLPEERLCDQFASTDWCEHPCWRPVGINPAFRYIWYDQGGELIVHYDAGYNPHDGRTHSLMSLVIYLTDCSPAFGGRTRFIKDPQSALPYAQRDFSDWSRAARPEEVLAEITPAAGRALIFDHRLLHDSEPWSGHSPKIIIRTDIMFEKVS